MRLITWVIDTTVLFPIIVLIVIIVCLLGMLFMSQYYKGRGGPLDARRGSRELICHMADRLSWDRTIAEAESVEKQVVKKEILEYLDEVKRLIDIELG